VIGKRRGLAASLAFFALTTPFGIAAHLFSELVGLGWHDDAEIVFSARHGYLAGFAVIALVSLIVAGLAVPRGLRRARAATLIEALPYRGRGAGFMSAAFVAQFGFFALTQIGEGSPLSGGNVVTGILAAAVAAALGAVTLTLCKRRILEFVAVLVWSIIAAFSAGALFGGRRAHRRPSALATRRTPFSFRYRPPPIAA
jgi:hypothetical protein